MSSELFECPADDCDTYMPLVKLERHYNSSHKDSLPDIGKLNKLDQSEKSDNRESKTDENPIMGLEKSENQQSTEQTTERTPEENNDIVCPECSGEVVDFSEHESGKYHNVNGSKLFVQGDYVCVECGGWFIDE